MRPERAILALLDESGGRHWADADDAALMSELLASDCCGRAITAADLGRVSSQAASR
jgi:hypothetical protein